MGQVIVEASRGVTVVGGGQVAARRLAAALALAPVLVAADGGADRAVALGRLPDAVIGDLDSLGPRARAALPASRIHRIAEQETTDFEKCLRSIAAPFVLGVGLAGPRLDHLLAALNVLARHPGRRCVLMGAGDIAFLCPPQLALDLPAGMRLSLFPLGPVTGESAGLVWPLGGIGFAADGRVGTSNRVAGGEVRLSFSAPRMVVILPAAALRAALAALAPGAVPPAPPAARGGSRRGPSRR
ncbi:MAG: thiamine diphosphokinase [Rhodobacteraceae bacterium]|nr:thiamine diphosphokinase [Paracoccaceae bacterium]